MASSTVTSLSRLREAEKQVTIVRGHLDTETRLTGDLDEIAAALGRAIDAIEDA